MPGVQVQDEVLLFDNALSLYPAVLSKTETECRKRLIACWGVLAKAFADDATGAESGFKERLTAAITLSGVES